MKELEQSCHISGGAINRKRAGKRMLEKALLLWLEQVILLNMPIKWGNLLWKVKDQWRWETNSNQQMSGWSDERSIWYCLKKQHGEKQDLVQVPAENWIFSIWLTLLQKSWKHLQCRWNQLYYWDTSGTVKKVSVHKTLHMTAEGCDKMNESCIKDCFEKLSTPQNTQRNNQWIRLLRK